MAPIIAMTLKSLSPLALGQGGALIQADFFLFEHEQNSRQCSWWHTEIFYVQTVGAIVTTSTITNAVQKLHG